MGEAVGVIRHIHAFWGFRFPGEGATMMDADEASDVLQEFELTLGGVEFAQAPAAERLLAS
jgi:hypothetical protein